MSGLTEGSERQERNVNIDMNGCHGPNIGMWFVVAFGCDCEKRRSVAQLVSGIFVPSEAGKICRSTSCCWAHVMFSLSGSEGLYWNVIVWIYKHTQCI